MIKHDLIALIARMCNDNCHDIGNDNGNIGQVYPRKGKKTWWQLVKRVAINIT